MTWLPWLLLTVAVFVAGLLGLAAYGASRWADSTRALLGQLAANRLQAATSHYDSRELEGLPAPVQRYFRAVLKDGQRIVTAVTVEHAGTFNLSETGEQWKPFTSLQQVVTRRPGFLWNARVSMRSGSRGARARRLYRRRGHAEAIGAGPVHGGRSAR